MANDNRVPNALGGITSNKLKKKGAKKRKVPILAGSDRPDTILSSLGLLAGGRNVSAGSRLKKIKLPRNADKPDVVKSAARGQGNDRPEDRGRDPRSIIEGGRVMPAGQGTGVRPTPAPRLRLAVDDVRRGTLGGQSVEQSPDLAASILGSGLTSRIQKASKGSAATPTFTPKGAPSLLRKKRKGKSATVARVS